MPTLSVEFGGFRVSRRAVGSVLLGWLLCSMAAASSRAGTPDAAREAYAVFAGAEERYRPPPATWFDEAQHGLKTQVERVDRTFAAQPNSDATVFWRTHLRWELLERNLGPASTVKLAELEEVRRWMYSNRQGLESPFFAPLRVSMDAYLDAVYATSQADLRGAFCEQVAMARKQCQAVGEEPTDSHAAALGRTLGWFERTGQLSSEVAAVRSLTSSPNAQIVLIGDLIRRIVATQTSAISEKVQLSERMTIPPGNRLQRPRTVQIRGMASTSGNVLVVPTPNNHVAELALIFEGAVDSRAHGVTGPVTLGLSTTGRVRAVKPLFLTPRGIEPGETRVTPQIQSHLTDVSADRDMVERIARRRADQADSQSLMNAQAHTTTVKQLKAHLDQHVDEAIAKLRQDYDLMQSSLDEFRDVTAPLVREGVHVYFDSAQSSVRDVEFNFYSRRREQHGAAAPCPNQTITGDVLVRVHVSFFNNMAETITGGKRLSDEFLMKYAKILHAELPLPLMVHSRARRWALTMSKQRPIELQNPEVNQFVFVVRIDAVEVDGVTSTAATTARIGYRLLRDEYGDYRLQREGDPRLDTTLPAETRTFVEEKVSAVFGPVLNGGGLVIPDGGILGALRGLRSKGVHAEHEWLVAGWDVPIEAVQEFIRLLQERVDSLPRT